MNPQVAPETKKLDAATSRARYIKDNPLKYTVTAKFDDDHITAAPNLSKSTSIKSALGRYQKNQRILKSSWMLISKDTLQNKAAGARKQAAVYNGAQQMVLEIKVTRRTVDLEVLTKKELSKYKYETVKVGNEEHYLTCNSTEAEVKLSVKGNWNPLTGEVQLYHYEESPFPGAPAMLDKYLVWKVQGNEIIGPAATR
jgi:hypothetical protein